MRGSDLFLCGRVSHEAFARAWSGNTDEYAELLHRMPKVVATTRAGGTRA
ncbi:hypothetical protein [Saccharothrix syringae]|nr:hypothetical protein [Saccharothrix syringae]